MTLIASILSLLFALIAAASYYYSRYKDQQVINQNSVINAQLNANNQQIAANQVVIDAEKEKAQQIQQSISTVEKSNVNQETIDKFFNSNGNNGSNGSNS